MFSKTLRTGFKNIRTLSTRQCSKSIRFRQYATYKYFDDRTRSSGSWGGLEWTPTMKRNFAIGISAVLAFLALNIEEAPVTKRKRLMIVPTWFEDKTAQFNYEQILAQCRGNLLHDNDVTVRKVKKIMGNLIKAAENYVDPDTGERVNLFADLKTRRVPDRPIDWKIHVIDDTNGRIRPTPNAFVIGDGKVFVFKSILQITENDDGLATVLAHELGHLVAHHIAEGLSRSPLYTAIGLIGYLATGSSGTGRIVSHLLLRMPASREMETEADYIGLMTMSLACYNPHEAPLLWRRMAKFDQSMGDDNIPEFLQTHPKSERRNQNMLHWMSKADRLRELGNCTFSQDTIDMFKFRQF